MTAVARMPVFVLTVLLAAATAAADVVVTAKEVISCRVVSADSSFVRLRLPMQRSRALPTNDVCELRLSNSRRVAELAAQLPRLRITVDSGQPVPRPAVRAEVHRQIAMREVLGEEPPRRTAGVETLGLNACSAEMAAKCREMDAALRECGRNDRVKEGLLREIDRETKELAKIPSGAAKYCVYAPCCGLLGAVLIGALGAAIGISLGEYNDSDVPLGGIADAFRGALIGSAVGVVSGAALGQTVGTALRRDEMKLHRCRVNDLIRKVNRAVAAVP